MNAFARRSLLQGAAGVGVGLLLSGLAAKADTPASTAVAPNGPHPAPPKPPPRPAWLNFQYAIAWERMNVLEEIVSSLVDKGTTDITLLISSSGGDMAAAISAYEFLTSVGITLTTYTIGNCYSAALLLFLAGNRRVCDTPGQFVIHPASAVTKAGSSSLDGLHLRAESLDRDIKRMRDIILSRTRMTKDQLDPMLMQHATFLDPKQAKDYGIVTEVAHLERPSNALLLSLPTPH